MRSRAERALLCAALALASACTSRAPAVHSSHAASFPPTSSPVTSPTESARATQPALPRVARFASLARGLSRTVALVNGGALYVAGGLLANGTTTANIERVDLSTGNVTAAGSLARATHDAGGAVLGARDFVFGGGVTATVDTIQVFSPGSSARAASARLPHPRSDLTVASDGTSAYIVGGYDGTTLSPDVWRTTDGATFTTIARSPVPVRYAAVAIAGGAIYEFGGQHGGAGTEVRAVQRIDPRTGSARVVAQLPQPLAHAVAVAHGGSIYLLGGAANGRKSARILRFDVATGRVTNAGHLPFGLSDAAVATTPGGDSYLVGGEVARGSSAEVFRVTFP